MSISLTLAFDVFRISGPILCTTRQALSFSCMQTFWRIANAAIPLPDGVKWFDDQGLRLYFTDPRGDPLTFINALTLSRLLETELLLNDFDLATLAYLKAIPPDTRVVLWWH